MGEFKDHFSGHAADYTRYRPLYPNPLFTFLAGLPLERTHAWDCATGSGQAARALAPYFEKVTASDGSATQIEHAQHHTGVDYVVATAENSGLPAHSVDLITVAQAVHWFDFEAFHREIRRVAKPGAVLALIGYDLFQVNPAVDVVVSSFYRELAEFWPPERRHVENHYAEIPFPYAPVETPDFAMKLHWSRAHCLGYVSTWSAVKRYQKERGKDPLLALEERLRDVWPDGEAEYQVCWPLILKIGRLDKAYRVG